MSDHEQDKIDLVRGEDDSILGGALCSGTPVLFTKNFGLVSIVPTDFTSQDLSMFVSFIPFINYLIYNNFINNTFHIYL